MNPKGTSLSQVKPNYSAAFTLTELVVVIGVVVLLAATLLPALASTKFRDQVTMCTANFRQWGVAWLTSACDSSDGSFPLPPVVGSGGNVWDEPLSLVSNMAPYGVTLPMWYCPVRPWEFAQDNAYIQSTLGHPEKTLTDFIQAVAYNRSPSSGFGLMYHNFWIIRLNGATFSPSTHFAGMPNPQANLGLPWPYDWLKGPSDPQAAKIPIQTDRIISYALTLLGTGTGHPAGGSPTGAVFNENLLYGDGHVETHQTNNMAWRYTTGLYVCWY